MDAVQKHDIPMCKYGLQPGLELPPPQLDEFRILIDHSVPVETLVLCNYNYNWEILKLRSNKVCNETVKILCLVIDDSFRRKANIQSKLVSDLFVQIVQG
eukprot:TRINITY_DN9946_c0_g1_i2.p5 TRINITY_DN9946_c0_g1~~TRINITY_DN9946_c0_g1_i2.p5  ORF type:complete len:100 (-),score=5.66 TRINITY_DN9946_c0_g1_i2:1078-1377(-)